MAEGATDRVSVRRLPEASILWRSPWPLLWLAVAYSTFSTGDIYVGPIPGKFVITGVALVVWLVHRRHASVPWRLPVVAVGIMLPLLGLAVALVGEATDSPAQALGMKAAAEEASRFVYVLLALPLLDWANLRAHRGDAHRLWLWPIVGLAVLTWLLYVAYLSGANYDGSGEVGPIRGDIAQDAATGWFRAFVVTQILFIPGIVLLFARLHVNPRQPADISLLILLLGGLMLAHTRGLWVGVLAGCGAYLILDVAKRSRGVWRGAVLAVACAAVVCLLVVLSAPTVLDSFGLAGGSKNEASSASRFEQVHELLDGFKDNPVVGSGMGAVLPSGYRRSELAPWSFELAYLQMLFQTGVVGILLLGWLPVVVLRDTIRRVLAFPASSVTAAAGSASLVGLVLSYASNPYLVTSAGTLALAISVAMCGEREQQRAGRT